MSDFNLDFIGVGAAKAGTSWLAVCLAEHPQVCVSVPKELNYFCTRQLRPKNPVNRGRGEHWLRARFSHWTEGQIRGEISPSYLIDPQSPDLIKQRFPDIKIIISFRNPTESLYSLYYQAAREFSVADTFEGFLQERSDVIQTGFYYTHTKRYLDYFPLEKIHFIFFDDILHHPEEVVADLYRFLGVETNYVPKTMDRRVNARKVPRSVLLRNFIGNARDLVNWSPQLLRIKRFLVVLGAEQVINCIYGANLRHSTFNSMEKTTRSRLMEIYAEEIMCLGRLLNRDLSHWNESNT